MNKIGLLIVFLLGLFLYGCGENINIDKVENEENIIETNKTEEENTVKNTMSESEIFENNLKCQDYKDKFIERSEHISASLEPIGITIFYSPIKNTCIGYFSTYYDNGKTGNDYLHTVEYFVVNAFDDSAEWSIYQYSINNAFNKKGCDWISGFGYNPNILKSECKTEGDVEKLWWDEINYLKGN